MRPIPCPIPAEELNRIYTELKLTDQQICEVVGNGTTVKRVRSWRTRYGIDTIPRLLRNDAPSIEGELKSLLVGSMLGDGRLARTPNGARYVENHADNQKAYLEWKVQQWGAWVSSAIKPVTWHVNGNDYLGHRFHTHAHPDLIPWHERFYPKPGPKQLTSGVIDIVDERALAIWYLDDGCASMWWPMITFGMNLESRRIARTILEKFGLTPKWVPRKRLTGEFTFDKEEQAERFIQIITPHVPEVMAYKLKFGFQGRGYDIRKASPEQILRELSKQGVPIKRIAKQLGLSASVVSRRLETLGIEHPRIVGRPV